MRIMTNTFLDEVYVMETTAVVGSIREYPVSSYDQLFANFNTKLKLSNMSAPKVDTFAFFYEILRGLGAAANSREFEITIGEGFFIRCVFRGAQGVVELISPASEPYMSCTAQRFELQLALINFVNDMKISMQACDNDIFSLIERFPPLLEC